MTSGYSDRIAHALAFAAKYAPPPRARGTGPGQMTHPANVAVILARHGCDETTIVAGILAVLLNGMDPGRRTPLAVKVSRKFREGGIVALEAVEPRYDTRGKERSWEACKMEFLAGLATAEPRVLEICVANEIFHVGALHTDVRRLGPEYLSGYAPGGADMVLRWFRGVVLTMERHTEGPRPAMLAELRALTSDLAGALESGG
ncbi:MAG: hypothetical protein ABI587_12050 [Gemmatimonadales bacterium]